MNEGGGPNGLTQSRLDVSSWVSGWNSKIITRNATFWGKGFLGNKKSLPLYFRNNSFVHLPWLIWWLVQQQKFLLLFMLTYVCEWVKKSKIYILFFSSFLVLFFGNCSLMSLVLFFLPCLEVVEIHPYFEWRWDSDPSVLVSSVWVSVVSEHDDWLVFLVSEWLVDDGSVGGRGWGAAGKPTIPKFKAPVV